MGPRSYMWSIIGQNVVTQHITLTLKIKKTCLKETEEKKENHLQRSNYSDS